MTCYEEIYGLRMKQFCFPEGQASRDVEPCRCISFLHRDDSRNLNIAAERSELRCGADIISWAISRRNKISWSKMSILCYVWTSVAVVNPYAIL